MHDILTLKCFFQVSNGYIFDVIFKYRYQWFLTYQPKRTNHHGTYTLCKPTLKHHQYKHHQRHESININSILTGCSDDHPAVRHASTCESHIHKSYTTRPKRANHHGTYTLCKPTLKHHQQQKSININPIHTRCSDDHHF